MVILPAGLSTVRLALHGSLSCYIIGTRYWSCFFMYLRVVYFLENFFLSSFLVSSFRLCIPLAHQERVDVGMCPSGYPPEEKEKKPQPSSLSLGRSLVSALWPSLLETLGPFPQIARFDAVIGC